MEENENNIESARGMSRWKGNKMDDSERLYKLGAKMSAIIFKLGLTGWQNELSLTDKNGKKADVRIKFDVLNVKEVSE